MATFEVKVYSIKIELHPNADAIELARVGDYLSIVRKGMFKDGDLAAYIPEASLLSESLIKELGLEGKLAGSNKNRVKAIRLRGICSQGLIYPAKPEWKLGDDVIEELGIVKWEPPVPTHLAGEVQSGPYKIDFDVENLKKYPEIFQEGEQVIFTEKIHGSCLISCLVPSQDRTPEMIDGKLIVISKGLAEQRLYFKDNEKNKENSYVKCAREINLGQRLDEHFGQISEPVWFLGELFGMQDLKYGIEGGKLQFRAFGIKIGSKWLDFNEFEETCKKLQIDTVPVLYKGPYSKQLVSEYTKGKELVTGKMKHLREGIVIYPEKERCHQEIGRVFLKSVSEDYLLRKDGTEFN